MDGDRIDGIEWRRSPQPVDYGDAVADMEARAAAVADGRADELVWLLEHPPLYTAGTSADASELLDPRFPVHPTGRGGRHTYHGPGQRIVYLVLNLDRRGRDLRAFVHALESWAIGALGDLGVEARAIDGRVGIWTGEGPDEAKIGAIGVRVRRWVTMHGMAINVDPALDHFGGIVPCGIADRRVTSLKDRGNPATMAMLDGRLQSRFRAFLTGLTSKNNS